MHAIVHGRPRPRKTLTEFDPVMLPSDASAFESWTAADIEANVSGRDVPSATNVMATMPLSRPTKQPKLVCVCV